VNHQIEHNADFGAARLIRGESFRREILRVIDLFFQKGHHRVKMFDVPDLDEATVLPGRRQNLFRFLQRSADRFLDQ
jgi:hypothetical protein